MHHRAKGTPHDYGSPLGTADVAVCDCRWFSWLVFSGFISWRRYDRRNVRLIYDSRESTSRNRRRSILFHRHQMLVLSSFYVGRVADSTTDVDASKRVRMKRTLFSFGGMTSRRIELRLQP